MKKEYMKPSVEVTEINMESALLAASAIGSDVSPDPASSDYEVLSRPMNRYSVWDD